MAPNSKRLVYFETWMDPAAERLLKAEPDIELVRLSFADPVAANQQEMRLAHGYQILPRTELRQPFFGDAELIERCPRLLAISATGAGYDMIDAEACTAAGILVVNQSGTNSEAVAEHALAMMLTLTKQLVQSDRAMRRTDLLDRNLYTGRELTRRTVGIVGIGNIGRRVAELCRTLFHMRVLAYDPYLAPEEIRRRGAEPAALDDLLRQADFVTLHCPRTAETMGMIGAREFALMKPTTYFITTARGGITDEAALVEALASGRLAGAGVDVFLQEPTPADHPLTRFENVILSPHIAGMTDEARYNMAVGAAEQWIMILRGERPPRLCNPEVWPRYAERYERVMGLKLKD
jgi:D-3-phosphoglycerate dehydrogenase / 2-oxoglutarate reductase